MSTITVHGMDLSYFTQKTLAGLQWYVPRSQLIYKNNMTPTEQAQLKQRSGTHQVPVVEFQPENWIVCDSTPIFQMLDTQLSRPYLYPGSAFTQCVVALVEEYFDEWQPRLAVHSRWNFPESAEFTAPKMAVSQGATSDEAVEQIANAIATWGKKACRATGISSPTQQKAGNDELLRVYGYLEAHLATNGVDSFLLGKQPCAVDAVMCGALRAHFLHDPWPRKHLTELKLVKEWCESTCKQTFDSSQLGSRNADLDPANLPLVIEQLLGEMQTCLVPFVQGNAHALAAKPKAAKSFTLKVYSEDVSFLTRPYIEKSRHMLRVFMGRALARAPDSERVAVMSLLKRFGMADTYDPLAAPGSNGAGASASRL